MPQHKIQWVNDHTQICDQLDVRGITNRQLLAHDFDWS